MKIVLASQSPQRKQILERLGIEFKVVVPEIDEVEHGEPAEVVLENARRKAAAVEVSDALVIGCDTDVVVEGRALGKPRDERQVREFLELLAGRGHEVLSGLVILGLEPGRMREGVARSVVSFRSLGAEEVDRYVASGEWRERAGGYAIQGLGSTLVERVEGDLSNVIGLPVTLLFELASELARR